MWSQMSSWVGSVCPSPKSRWNRGNYRGDYRVDNFTDPAIRAQLAECRDQPVMLRRSHPGVLV